MHLHLLNALLVVLFIILSLCINFNDGKSGEPTFGRGDHRKTGAVVEVDGYRSGKNSDKDLLLVGTMDSQITAMDLESGRKLWSMKTGKKLLSSSVSNIEFIHNGVPTRLVPSLDSSLFRFGEDSVVYSTPFTAESLLSSSMKLSPDLTAVGSVESMVYGVDALTGKILYKCGDSGCPAGKSDDLSDADRNGLLIIKHKTQTVRVISVVNGDERWNFSVGQQDLEFIDNLVRQGQSDGEGCDGHTYSKIGSGKDAKLSLKFDVDSGKVFFSQKSVTWNQELSSQIAKAWHLKNGFLQEIDLLNNDYFIHEKMGEFSSTDEVEASPLLYLGVFEDQMYVRQSPRYLQSVGSDAVPTLDGRVPRAEKNALLVVWPQFHFQPLMATAPSRTPVINHNNQPASKFHQLMAKQSKGKASSSVLLTEYPYDGGYYLYADSPYQLAVPKKHGEGAERVKSRVSLPGAEQEEESMFPSAHDMFTVYWKEMLFTNIATAVLAICLYRTCRKRIENAANSVRNTVVSYVRPLLPKWVPACAVRCDEVGCEEFPSNSTNEFDESEQKSTKEGDSSGKNPGRKSSHSSESEGSIEVSGASRRLSESTDASGTLTRKQSEASEGRSIEEPPLGQPVSNYSSKYLNEFEHKRVIGKGGFGVVFEALNKMDDVLYAVKRITLPSGSERRDRVMREVRALAKMDHPNIVRYFQTWFERPPPSWQEEEDRERLGLSEALSGDYTTSQSMDSQSHYNVISTNPSASLRVPVTIPEDDLLIQNLSINATLGLPRASEQASDTDSWGASGSLTNSNPNPNKFFYNDDDDSDEEDSEEDEISRDTNYFISKNSASGDSLVDSLFGNDSGIQFKEDSTPAFPTSSSEGHLSEPFRQYFNKGMESAETENSQDSQSILRNEDRLVVNEGGDNSKEHHDRLGHDDNEKAEEKVVPGVAVSREYMYLQMQLCRHDDLQDFLRKREGIVIERKQVVGIMKQLLNAVSYIHSLGMIHRDIKPSNIFFAKSDMIKVGDFGLVKLVQDGDADTGAGGLAVQRPNEDGERSSTGSSSGRLSRSKRRVVHTDQVGTQLYMSPEQIALKKYSNKVDIFALGLVFLELFVPFGTHMERVRTLTNAKKGRLPEDFKLTHPQEFEMVKWMVTKNPDNRPDIKLLEGSDLALGVLQETAPFS